MARHEDVEDIATRLAQTQLETDPIAKSRLLEGVIDELIADSSAVLDNYQDEICQFVIDEHADVRLIITKFIIHAIQVDLDSLTTLSTTITELLSDGAAVVVRKTLVMLVHMCAIVAKREKLEMPVKEGLLDVLGAIQARLSSDNDGIRTQALRTVEAYCTLSAECEPMIDSARQSIKDFLKEPIISSGNIVTGLFSLWRLAKTHPSRHLAFMVQQYESVHANLPPTLSATQVENVRKILKLQLLDLVRTCGTTSQPYHAQIAQLLADLGVKDSEFQQAVGGGSGSGAKSEKRKRKDKDDKEPTSKRSKKDSSKEELSDKDKIDDLAQKMIPLINIDIVTELVIASMKQLPERMPAAFSATYTPIESAGTEPQKAHLARMLATQIIQLDQPTVASNQAPSTQAAPRAKRTAPRIKAEAKEKRARERSEPFKLDKVTPSMSKSLKLEMARFSAEHLANQATKNQQTTRHLMLTRIVAEYGSTLSTVICDILDNHRACRMDLSMTWLYAEYTNYLANRAGEADTEALESYNCCIELILTILTQQKCMSMMAQIIKQAPMLTARGLLVIRDLCENEENCEVLLLTLGELCLQRPKNRIDCMSILLEFANHYNTKIRIAALDQIVSIYSKLYTSIDINNLISKYLEKYLVYLKYENPPQELSDISEQWFDDLIERCLALALAILPQNANVLRDLAKIYTKTKSTDVQKTILRALDAPVRQLDQTNPDLLSFIRECPDYCETFVHKVLHILTDKSACKPELVEAVRHLVVSRKMDVRIQIPVLGALTKSEVIKALPELITFDASIVKTVFYRLLGVQKGQIAIGVQTVAPLTAVELLIELHKMEGEMVKPSIEAIKLCLNEKSVFTFEVFASAIDKMLTSEQLPTLFMRTVLQALITHPRMSSQIVSVLIKLIDRQIWNTPKMWDGFVLCCQRLKAKCAHILLSLPEHALLKIIQTAPDLNTYLATYLDQLDQTKRSSLDPYFTKIVQQQLQLQTAA